MNLKQVLMDLGNRLVTEHRFLPAVNPCDEQDGPSTWPIRHFTEWLNSCPEAREELAALGVEWPVAKSYDDAFAEGHGAFGRLKREQNPYPKGTEAHDGWDKGWWDRYEGLRTDPLP